ncbi:OmpA family protein [Undibacterium fentianense]|uniref:OmpA family protein n=1 Tax=Undibacterium fentianense TaxID=2828728 RepID=A0A941DZU2_9BURK|nr:OmpA family protein [Undibacterium fentianense]MBR7800574.1 OmpA family protein [Undibacterium fentianense]
MLKPRLALLLYSSLFFVIATPHAQAQTDEAKYWGKDVTSSMDHPFIKRFTGSWLTGYSNVEWDISKFPTSNLIGKDKKFQDVVTLEGKQTRILYLAPRGKMPVEVFRNYQQALLSAGVKMRWVCETQCSALYWAWRDMNEPNKGMQWAEGSIYTPTSSRYSHSSALSPDKGMMLVGSIKRGDQETQVLLYTSVAAFESTGLSQTYIHIAEPKPMPTNQVEVDVKALQISLREEGKVTLKGLFFDTGKANIKEESKAQLDEIAKLLQAQPSRQFFIVGHTDNVGNFDANQTLSQQRAQAVVNALLAAPYRINASRLVAKGNANLAPVASNTEEAGRARNRRVELVEQ